MDLCNPAHVSKEDRAHRERDMSPVSECGPVSVQQSHELDQGVIRDIDTCIEHRKLHPPAYHLGKENGTTAGGGGYLCE